MNNLEYFELATTHKETLIDPDYHNFVDRTVIPLTANEQNALTIANEKVLRYISSIQTLTELGRTFDDKDIENILYLIIEELNTPGMNYSAFCQYFNIHNLNYSVFSTLNVEEKKEALKYLTERYISDRHNMYLSHGYSNIVLQVMSDNYSHKRKGTYGTNKIAACLNAFLISDLTKLPTKSFDVDVYYLLSDKTGKKLFQSFAQKLGIRLTDVDKETEKYPDAFIKIGNEYYIVEQKNMKENGGGQDKQTLEITDFIDKEPESSGIHYITFIDGIYFNQIDKNAKAKPLHQYHDILNVLSKRPENYFVNSFSFSCLIKDKLAEFQKNVSVAKKEAL